VIQFQLALLLVWRHGQNRVSLQDFRIIFAWFSHQGASGRDWPRHPAGVEALSQKAFVSTGIGAATIRS
jgi:hypothetical protein